MEIHQKMIIQAANLTAVKQLEPVVAFFALARGKPNLSLEC